MGITRLIPGMDSVPEWNLVMAASLLAAALLTRAPRKHRLAPVVVFDPLAPLLLGEPHVEVEAEVTQTWKPA